MPDPRRFAFVALHTTGADLDADAAFRFVARIPGTAGRAREIDWLADPGPALRTRAARALPEGSPELEGLPRPHVVFASFEEALEGRTWIAFERDPCLRWVRALRIAASKARGESQALDAPDPVVVGVADLARLVLPGRRTAEREALLRLAFAAGEAPEADLTPGEIERLLGGVCRAALSRSAESLHIGASLLAHVLSRLSTSDPPSARILEAGLDLLDRPSAWRTSDAQRFPEAAELVDGVLSAHVKPIDEALALVDDARPRFASDLDENYSGPPLADAAPAPVALDAADDEALRAVFEDLLPDELGAGAARPQQLALARAVGAALSGSQVCLVDAPTGTGKTLAYLVPALLWAVKAKTRVGVSTYTIALQEQVFDRELPRAFALLSKAGALSRPDARPAATLLKGRERYLCARGLRAAAPDLLDPPETWLAWTVLVLFALDDRDGDLDRLARRLPIWVERKGPAETAYQAMLRDVRSRPWCCEDRQDRRQCGAYVARRRAERCHLVVTNHAFVLRDPLFLRNLVADECEHLHPQARDVASAEIPFRLVQESLTAFAAAGDVFPARGARARDLLARVERALAQRNLFESHALGRACADARLRAGAAASSLDEIEILARPYATSVKEDSEGGFQAFAASPEVAPRLLAARTRLTDSLAELAGLAKTIAEGLDAGIVDGAARLRVKFQQSSLDFAALAAEIQNWLPLADGELRFDPTCFYDVEKEDSKQAPLVAVRHILLPHRWLAERYYPSMQSLVLVSASTWLGGSFDLARRYLGLDHLEAGSENREPRPVASHRSPPTFDYSRMLLTIPTDTPETSFADAASRRTFDEYLTRFVLRAARGGPGGTLVLLTNLRQCRELGRALQTELRERGVPFYFQGMDGFAKEELPRAFRSAPGAVLMGVDTFWYGVDFPGELLETVVVAKLPFGAPDRYSRAQERALGRELFQQTLYMPEALTMFRQGVGRLLRRESDFGSVHVLDARVLGRWKRFLRELPGLDTLVAEENRMRVVTAASDECLREASEHAERLRGDTARTGPLPKPRTRT